MARILVVDDERGVRRLLSNILLNFGHQVIEASSVDEAERLLSTCEMDVVMTDLIMPRRSGLDLLAYTKKNHPFTAVIVVSAVTDLQTAQRVLDDGAYSYMMKPFDMAEVAVTLTSALRRRDLELQNRTIQDELRRMVDRQTRQLCENEERYRSLVETMSEGLTVVDDERRFEFMNDRFAEMLGYRKDELIGRLLEDLLGKEARRKVAEQFELRRKGLGTPYELVWNKKDGSKLRTMVYPRPIFGEAGRFIGSQALVADITEQKRLESQLLQAQKLEAIGQLAAGIAHEINTPSQYVSDNVRFMQKSVGGLLAVLSGYEKIVRRLKDDPDFGEDVARVQALAAEVKLDFLFEELPIALEESLEGLARITKIVKSMKAFAHPGTDQLSPADLNKAIEDTITVARNEWKYVADVSTDLDPALPLVPCVLGELNQVVLNIIINAAHAIEDVVGRSGKDKGLITVATRQDGRHAQIVITDTGAGIPAEFGSKIFDPFFTTKEPGKGTGQGLAIAHRVIVEKHKGEISYASQPGQGTTFVIRLPLMYEAAAPSEAGAPGA